MASAPEAAKLDDSSFHVLPYVPVDWLNNAFRRHQAEDLELVFGHKIVPFRGISPLVLHAVVSEEAWQEARRMGLKVVARITPRDYRTAVERHHGRLALKMAVFGLAKYQPDMSASIRLSDFQVFVVAGLVTGAIMLGILKGAGVLNFAAAIASILFFAMVVAIRSICLLPLPRPPAYAPPALRDEALPAYTVLVPLFKETEVLGQLMTALFMIDYPKEKLDIKLILEEGDAPMRRAVAEFDLPPHFDIVIVPAGKPQTKPRALSYALQFAQGALVTIYDAEDVPDQRQLRQAAAAFATAPAEVVCLQAALCFYNPNDNWLTRQFAAEYASLFKIMLPALAKRKLPILLGGTSNHFRRRALEACGGWDPFNVTEDADLGLRLARMGLRCDLLASNTLEEANIELGNWLRQRRRWLKGFLQSWLVHMREPLRLYRELGAFGFWTTQCLTLGVFCSALLHPFLLAFGIWNLTPNSIANLPNTLAAYLLAVLSVTILLGGYAAAMIMAARGLALEGMKRRWGVIATLPFYWLLMSVAAWLAVWDFAVKPFYWHKTRHGLSSTPVTGRQP